ncbi:MAG: hypothetical protein IKI54_06195, partial [Lachnospiraceae bacterium]|nr:hypothetical protein [Lachnospiraceae bacterium]
KGIGFSDTFPVCIQVRDPDSVFFILFHFLSMPRERKPADRSCRSAHLETMRSHGNYPTVS